MLQRKRMFRITVLQGLFLVGIFFCSYKIFQAFRLIIKYYDMMNELKAAPLGNLGTGIGRTLLKPWVDDAMISLPFYVLIIGILGYAFFRQTHK